MNKKITMLVLSKLINDPRVYKTATTAKKNNFIVNIVCLLFNDANCFSEFNIRLIDKTDIMPENLKSFTKKIKNNIRKIKKQSTSDNISLGNNVLVHPKNGNNISYKELIEFITLIYLNLNLFFKGLAFKSEIYHANDLNTLPAAFALATLRRSKLVYDSHELYVEQTASMSIPYKKLLSFIEKIFIRRADAVITVNDSIAEILSERYNIPLPITIMNCPSYQPPKNFVINDIKKLIYLGRYTEDRGIEELILSMKYVENAKLYLRGFGPHEDFLRALALNNNLSDKVIFLEPVNMTKMVDSLEGFDIGIVPYKPVSLNNKLASPNKIFEYMMAGLPIAASDSPELRKIVKKNNVGILFDPYDPKDIADKINYLVENDKTLKEMRDNALRVAKSEYNWEVQSKRLIGIYDSLINS